MQHPGFNPNQNTIFLVTHGRHVVVYLQEWKGVKEPVKRFFERLVRILDEEEINLLQLCARPGWEDRFQDPRHQAVIHLLAASLLQEAIGHLRREDSDEGWEHLPQQRSLLNEVLEHLLNTFAEHINVQMVELWKKANDMGHDAPEYAPPPGFLDYIGRLTPAGANP